MNPAFSPEDPALLSRREALRRAAALLGCALTPSLIEGVLRAQPAAAGPGLPAAAARTLAALAERILPRTDTPGAVDVGVPAFIGRLFEGFLTDAERERLTAGVAALDRSCAARSGRPFAELEGAGQDEAIRGLAAGKDEAAGDFLRLVRELVIVGYFTSEQIGKTLLRYDPVPGRYDADIPLAETGGAAWNRP
jgi:hypothetical protein